MAEYIDRDIAIKEWYRNNKLGKSARTIFNEIPKADVIERSEYEKVLANSRSHAKIIANQERRIKDLYSKVDSAIEEIKQEIQNGTIKLTSGNEKLFNILENIGE